MSSKRTKNHIIQSIYQREIGLNSHLRDDLLRSYAEEKASLPNKNQPCEISDQTRATHLMELSADGKRLASTHGDHSIRVTDIRTGKCTHTLNGHPRTPWCIAFHPSNDDILGSGCLGGEVRIWDLQGGGSEVWHCDEALSIASMTFHPLDNVAVFAVSNKLHFWDWTRPEPFAVCMTAHDFEKIRWVKFDRIGHRLLTAIANTSDEAFSNGLRFSLFNDHSAEHGRFPHSGTIDATQPHGNSSGVYQAHRMPTSDDSLMDLRTRWSENRSTNEQTRRLNSAQRYAYGVTNQASRSSLDGRLMFESEANLSPPADRDGVIDHQRTTAQSSSDPYGFDLSTRSGPLLLSASQNSGSSSNDWLSAPHERELEAGDALLSLATDGRQTPSRYIHGLSGDGIGGAQRRFLSGDDPLSENLTLLEPGYVEVTPSTSSYEDSLERTIAASSPAVPGTDELSSAATLDQLLRQDGGADTNHQPTDLNRDVFQPGGRTSDGNVPSDGRMDSVLDVQPGFSRTEGDTGRGSDGLTDIWLNSARNWDTEPSLSLTGYPDFADARGDSQNALMTPCESGLDLRLWCPDGEAGNMRDVPDHCYAMPALSSERPSPTSEEMEISLQSEDGSANASAVSQSPTPSNWLTEPCLNLTTLRSRSRRRLSLSNDDSREAASNVGGSTGSADATTGDNSSARCRIFPLSIQRAGSATSSLSAAASANVTSARDAASFSSFRVRQEARSQDSRAFGNLRRIRRNHCHGTHRAGGHTFDRPGRNWDAATAGCVVCSGANSQVFGPSEPQPSTSGGGHASLDGHRPGRSADEEFPVACYFQLPDLASARPESHDPASREVDRGRPSGPGQLSFSSRPRLFRSSDSLSGRDVPTGESHAIPRIEIFSDDLDERVQSSDGRGSPMQQGMNEQMRYLEPVVYRPTIFGGSRLATMSERLRERRERINFHVEELRARFGSSSSAAGGGSGSSNDSGRGAGLQDDDLFAYREAGGSPALGSGADAVGESIGNEDRERIVSRLRGFREEMRVLRQDRFPRSYRYYMPNRSLRSGWDSVYSGEADIHSLRVNAALNRAISGALAANGDSSVGSNISDPTFRIQAWSFMRCQIPDISDSESNILVRRAKIHNDANVDISQDGRFICTFTLPTRSFSGDIVLSVFSLTPENFGECLFTKNFGPNAISVSLSPCNNYVLVGLATKRFTWMFTPKQMVAQVFRLKIPRGGEDSTEHVCDITHPCDSDFRAPISINSAKWLLGPGEGLAYGTNRGDLNICRPGFEQVEKPDVNDNLSESVPIRRNLMQMLGISVPRMMNSATQTSHNARRSASTQTDQNSHSSSSSLASTSSSAVATLDSNSQAANMDAEDLNLL